MKMAKIEHNKIVYADHSVVCDLEVYTPDYMQAVLELLSEDGSAEDHTDELDANNNDGSWTIEVSVLTKNQIKLIKQKAIAASGMVGTNVAIQPVDWGAYNCFKAPAYSIHFCADLGETAGEVFANYLTKYQIEFTLIHQYHALLVLPIDSWIKFLAFTDGL
jgi:hypothetical protein